MSVPIREYWNDQAGLTSVEYAVLMAVLVVACIAAWGAVGEALSGKASAYKRVDAVLGK